MKMRKKGKVLVGEHLPNFYIKFKTNDFSKKAWDFDLFFEFFFFANFVNNGNLNLKLTEAIRVSLHCFGCPVYFMKTSTFFMAVKWVRSQYVKESCFTYKISHEDNGDVDK